MSYGWDAYLTEIDEDPISIVLDLDAGLNFQDLRLPFVCQVNINLQKPGDDGLHDGEENSDLNEFEDAFETVVIELKGKYVGRCTGKGKRALYAYLPTMTDTKEILEKALASCAKYDPELNLTFNSDWSYYFEGLFPNPEELRVILNEQVLRSLEEGGDPLDSPREIDHWIYFPSEETMEVFKKGVVKDGFTVRAEGKEGGDLPYAIHIAREDAVDRDSIHDMVLDLFRKAEDLDGDYDGWETYIVN